MPNCTNHANVICPFYVTDDEVTITCEGLLDETEVSTRFCMPIEKQMHILDFCQQYEAEFLCPIAAALMMKYT